MAAVAMKLKALFLTDEVAVPVRAVLSAIRDAGSRSVEEDDVLVITQSDSLGGKLPIESATLDVIVSIYKAAELVGEQWLEEIGRVLKPGGKVLVQTSLDKPGSALERKFFIAGFLELQAFQGTQSLTIKGKKASWTMGTSFAIKKATKIIPAIQIDDDSDLIDEDSLLTEDDLKKPPPPPVGDCEVGSTRKACKNCTCGRAETEQKVQKLGLTAEQINNPKSACGNCGLGDAFRCGGCPYSGLPPFKLGEKVSLSGNFLLADI